MITKLRNRSQITIPKKIVDSLGLVEDDLLDISLDDGKIILEPVAIYSKEYVNKLEQQNIDKKSDGPFSSAKEIKAHLKRNKDS